jgi:hypothetical protein
MIQRGPASLYRALVLWKLILIVLVDEHGNRNTKQRRSSKIGERNIGGTTSARISNLSNKNSFISMIKRE